MKKYFYLAALLLAAWSVPAVAQNTRPAQDLLRYHTSPFAQLEQLLPTPNRYRSASGAPGPDYWQQQADYVIDVKLDTDQQTITGAENITYHNNSPDVLTYLWLQLDQNNMARGSDGQLVLDQRPIDPDQSRDRETRDNGRDGDRPVGPGTIGVEPDRSRCRNRPCLGAEFRAPRRPATHRRSPGGAPAIARPRVAHADDAVVRVGSSCRRSIPLDLPATTRWAVATPLRM